MSTPVLILLPGLGADHRLFGPQLESIEGTRVPAWIGPMSDPETRRPETITRYAARFAEHLADQGTLASPYAFVGFSFGGQIALEITRHLLKHSADIPLPAAVVLISAPRTDAAITDRFCRQQRLAGFVPNPLLRLALRAVAPRFARVHDLDEHWTGVLKDMARDADLAMLRWGARAAAGWAFSEQDARDIESAGVPIAQIHAEHDPIIPYNADHADITIPGKAHLMTWTHAERVNDFILKAVAGVEV